ncbi:MAG: aspartate aminotransferase family protein [Deltaproteobacteria bacterium]|nr:MAG: aspartate aminotransferase family protein [Deltaproteobacteria bacterium]
MKKRLIEQLQKHLINNYNRLPVVLVKGKGCRVWDSNDQQYLDFASGIAVNNLGHCHPRVVRAIQAQAKKLIHVSNFYYIEPQIELARLLTDNSFADRVFFGNSGSEANEAAIKLARKYGNEVLGGKYEIITAYGSFHGRTIATVTATGQEKFHTGFQPLLSGFKYIPFNDLEAARTAISPKTCALMVEPIQGEGGVILPSDIYLKGLKKICREKGILLIYDEVQVGMGRTGRLFAYENYGAPPDIMTLAKSLGGGVAIGAMLTTEKLARSLTPGSHASTFGGNPLATAAGVAAVSAILEDGVLENCRKMGKYLHAQLTGLRNRFGFIKDIRGKGLMIGVEIEFEGAEIVKRCLEKGLLINCTAGKVLRFLPPLIVTKKEIDEAIKTVTRVLSKI